MEVVKSISSLLDEVDTAQCMLVLSVVVRLLSSALAGHAHVGRDAGHCSAGCSR